MKDRWLKDDIASALDDTPVVFINGARQVGKSTLARSLGESGFGERANVPYVTFDSLTDMAAADTDPDAYLAGFDGPVIIDEAQKVPDIFRAIKRRVDRSRQPGQYLLTGSANVLTLPQVSESLAGRMEIFTLRPFSRGEILGRKESFTDACFARGSSWWQQRRSEDSRRSVDAGSDDPIWTAVARGGYPEVQLRTDPKRIRAWFESYISTILQRDIRDFSRIEGLTELPRLLQLVASRTGSLANYSELSRSSRLPVSTLKRYLALLEMTFLVHEVSAWSTNLSKRLVKSPKLFVSDSGLATQLAGLDASGLPDHALKGALLETFVVAELKKQISWSNTRPEMFHYRTSGGAEVDVVLESRTSEVVGVEVKASTTVTGSDFSGLRSLQETAGDRFRRGVILYGGNEVIQFESNLTAAPISTLWA